MSPAGPDTVLAPQPGAELQHVDGTPVLLEANGVVVRGLNATGAQVWARCDGRTSLGAIARALAAEHQAPLTEVEPAVLAFARELEAAGLLRRAG